MSVQSVCGELFGVWISVLHRWSEHEFVVAFITYYTLYINSMDLSRFTLKTILCKKVVQVM